MKSAIWIVIVGVFSLLVVDSVVADDSREAVDIFLEDEQLDVEADIPSVDLVLSFKGLRYESIDKRKSFLPELFESVEGEPF